MCAQQYQSTFCIYLIYRYVAERHVTMRPSVKTVHKVELAVNRSQLLRPCSHCQMLSLNFLIGSHVPESINLNSLRGNLYDTSEPSTTSRPGHRTDQADESSGHVGWEKKNTSPHGCPLCAAAATSQDWTVILPPNYWHMSVFLCIWTARLHNILFRQVCTFNRDDLWLFLHYTPKLHKSGLISSHSNNR